MLTARHFLRYQLQLHVRCQTCGAVTGIDLQRIAKLWPARDLLAERTYRCSLCRGAGVPYIVAPAAVPRLKPPGSDLEKELPFALERWGEDGQPPYRTLARAVDSRLIRAAFEEAQRTTHKGEPLMVRLGTRVEGQANWPSRKVT
jgi:hypothetical protein